MKFDGVPALLIRLWPNSEVAFVRIERLLHQRHRTCTCILSLRRRSSKLFSRVASATCLPIGQTTFLPFALTVNWDKGRQQCFGGKLPLPFRNHLLFEHLKLETRSSN